MGVQPRGHVVDDEVRERLGELAAVCLGVRERHALVEKVGRGAVLHQMARVVGGEPEVGGKARGLLIGQLGQLRPHALDKLVGEVVGCQIRLGEQAVVVGGLLHAHDDSALRGRIPVARLLVDDAALLEHLGLTADLVGQPVVQVLERVHVLQLGLGAERGGAAAAQRHVAVAAQGAFLHGAVGDA